MAEISPDALVPRASGPVADVFLLAPVQGGPMSVLKVYPRALDRRTYSAVEVEQAKLAGLRTAPSLVLVQSFDELPDGRTGLRMEFCPQSLPDLVANGPLPVSDVIVLGQILASALAEAHSLGLVHGGVTPANVLERSNGQPALSDFGVALRLRFPRDLTTDAAYTAPEVLRDGELSEEADVYGLGAVLYLALSGHAPFPVRTGQSSDDLVLRVLREPVPEVTGRDVPAALAGLLMRMLAKEPENRPTAPQVVTELEALLFGPAPGGADEVDFDDFQDELAAGRAAQVAPAPTPIKTTKPRKPSKPTKPPKNTLVVTAAAVSVLAIALALFQPWKVGEIPQSTVPPPAAPTVWSSQSPGSPPGTVIKLKPPKDNGTTVILEWTSTIPLTFAVLVAEQGAEKPSMSYRGKAKSLTVAVSPGLKYCFEIQGTNGASTHLSKPTPIRGATCQS